MRKFAKISAVLAAMVLALAFAGCNSSSDDDDGNGTSSTKNILAGKTYYSIDFKKMEYTSAETNKVKIRVSMCAFDSNGQKAKWAELAYDFKNGAVDKNNNNIIQSDEFDYSVSGSTLTIKDNDGGDDLICTINSDGSISADGSVMKELKGNLYAFAKAEPDSEELLATAYIIIVDGTACNLEQHTYSSKNGLDDPFVLEGTVSGSTLKFTSETKGGQTKTVHGTLFDKEIKLNDSPDGPITLKRM